MQNIVSFFYVRLQPHDFCSDSNSGLLITIRIEETKFMRHQINLPKEGKKQRKLRPAILRTIFNFLNVHFQFKTETE